MVKGVQQSAAFLLVLTKGIFTRPFCRLEIITAIKAKKPFITVVEVDPRYNSFSFAEAAKDAPATFAPIIQRITSDICAVKIRRDSEERQVMLRKIVNTYFLGLGKVLDFTEAQICAATASIDGAAPLSRHPLDSTTHNMAKAQDWPVDVLLANLKAVKEKPPSTKLCVLLTTGALNPIHRGHADQSEAGTAGVLRAQEEQRRRELLAFIQAAGHARYCSWGFGKKGQGVIAAATAKPRTMFISATALNGRWKFFSTKKKKMLHRALFFFGSKRSWLFHNNNSIPPLTPFDNRERRKYDLFQPAFKALILEKGKRGEVFFLKPETLKYRGFGTGGDPGAFKRASDWLETCTNPMTGSPYLPLKLDPAWWHSSFDPRQAKYSSRASMIVKNLLTGEHDYGPTKELLSQSNPGAFVYA